MKKAEQTDVCSAFYIHFLLEAWTASLMSL